MKPAARARMDALKARMDAGDVDSRALAREFLATLNDLLTTIERATDLDADETRREWAAWVEAIRGAAEVETLKRCMDQLREATG